MPRVGKPFGGFVAARNGSQATVAVGFGRSRQIWRNPLASASGFFDGTSPLAPPFN